MKYQQLYTLLTQKNYPIFSYEELLTFFPKEKGNTVKQCLTRFKKQEKIYSLRRGVYELANPYSGLILPDIYLANKIYAPSYVSLETALSIYGLIPEVAMAVTSITVRPTRKYKNTHGLFIYRSVQPKAFCGYRIEKHNGFDVQIAEPEKALIDYIYFKTLKGKKLDMSEERFDRKKLSRLNKMKLKQYASIYKLNLKDILDVN